MMSSNGTNIDAINLAFSETKVTIHIFLIKKMDNENKTYPSYITYQKHLALVNRNNILRYALLLLSLLVMFLCISYSGVFPSILKEYFLIQGYSLV